MKIVDFKSDSLWSALFFFFLTGVSFIDFYVTSFVFRFNWEDFVYV